MGRDYERNAYINFGLPKEGELLRLLEADAQFYGISRDMMAKQIVGNWYRLHGAKALQEKAPVENVSAAAGGDGRRTLRMVQRADARASVQDAQKSNAAAALEAWTEEDL